MGGKNESYYAVAEGYCRSSGIHGFQYLTKNWSLVERVIWLVLIIIRFQVFCLITGQYY